MTRKLAVTLGIFALCLAFTLPAIAQVSAEAAVKGNLGGTVFDSSGAVIPGAKVTVSGPSESRTVTSDDQGRYFVPLLTPGLYSVKVEKSGFRVSDTRNVEVLTGRTSTLRATLQPGSTNEVVEVTEAAITIDTNSTAIGANLPDTFYESLPVARGVAQIFYISPGVASGGRSGIANPSISGGSGLENLYVADGVNITDQAFGGLGTFSRNYGSLGTGINLTFVKEVQVKTGGYEPQYGKATGGIVQIVTKTGSNAYHGAIRGFFQPSAFEAERRHADDFGRVNPAGKTLNEAGYDVSGELGGFLVRDKVFFFASFNPSLRQEFVLAPPTAGLFSLREMHLNTKSYNYSGKLTFSLNANNRIEASLFGDPSRTNTGPYSTVVAENQTVFGKLKYGTRSLAARYNGVMSPTWLVNLSGTWGHNTFNETPAFPNLNSIVDRTQTAGLPGQKGQFTAVGYGFFEPTSSDSPGVNADTSKTFNWLGEHNVNIGYRFERPLYRGTRERTGPTYAIPATNAALLSLTDESLGAPPDNIGAQAQASLSLRLASPSCTLCPLLNVPGLGPVPVFLRGDRNEINFPFQFKTSGVYHAGYLNERWSPNKYFTASAGIRWEQQRLEGETFGYTFPGEWSPRFGLTIDPFGDRRTKLFANFGRYTYGIPLDMAERSLTNEVSLLLMRWAPQFTTDASGNRIAVVNQFGTVNPVFDAAHLLNRVGTFDPDTGDCIDPAGCGTGGALFPLGQSTTAIAPRTRMPYVNEWVAGFERELAGGVIVSARYVDRRYTRIVEDIAGLSPEAANAGIAQNYIIANVNAATDLFVNERPFSYTPGLKEPCGTKISLDPVEDSFGNTVGAVCFQQAGVAPDGTPLFGGETFSDGIPDGFPNPVRKYQAVEIEVNKSLSKSWQMRANWRIARLFGNFEGAFRNDNGQTDPSISSLFDFTQGIFGLLGDQFKPGHLNTDRRHVANIYASYTVPTGGFADYAKGLTLGLGARVESGIPINDLKAHPAYLNAGEVPVGGRGALGRTAPDGSLDLHADYPWAISESKRVRVAADFFNVLNMRKELNVDQFEDLSFGTRNLDFLKPGSAIGGGLFGRRFAFQRPFYARFGVSFEF